MLKRFLADASVYFWGFTLGGCLMTVFEDGKTSKRKSFITPGGLGKTKHQQTHA